MRTSTLRRYTCSNSSSSELGGRPRGRARTANGRSRIVLTGARASVLMPLVAILASGCDIVHPRLAARSLCPRQCFGTDRADECTLSPGCIGTVIGNFQSSRLSCCCRALKGGGGRRRSADKGGSMPGWPTGGKCLGGVAALVLVTSGLVPAGAASAWSIVPSPSAPAPTDELAGVSCLSATSCIAVGDQVGANGVNRTLVERWNGTSWSVQPSASVVAPSILTAVSC